MSDSVMIITGESSGELYGSLLAKELKALKSGVRILGVGGEKMKDAGVEVFSGVSGAFGFFEAVSSYKAVRNTFNKTLEMMNETIPSLVVLVDYPDFNFRVARAAKAKGIKVLYYVSPQVWVWRKNRIKTMAEIADRLAVILPFEEEIYKGSGIPCEFVGHPVLDESEGILKETDEIKKRLGIQREKPVLALLPGSRKSELKRHLPLLIDFVKRFRKEFPDYQFFVPVAPNLGSGVFGDYLKMLEDEGVRVKKENALLALSVSEMAVIASGTAALQAAVLGIPMVVIYKVFPLSYVLARLILDVRYICLVNILTGREAVPELIQRKARPENIIRHLKKIMFDKQYRDGMAVSFKEVRAMFEGKKASRRVAEIAAEMAGWKV